MSRFGREAREGAGGGGGQARGPWGKRKKDNPLSQSVPRARSKWQENDD